LNHFSSKFYESEYNHYQEENATDGIVLRFGGVQVRGQIPSLDENLVSKARDSSVNYRESPNQNEYYATDSDRTSHTYVPPSDIDYPSERVDSYLAPTSQSRTIAGNVSDEAASLLPKETQPKSAENPRVNSKQPPPVPPKPQSKRDDSGDSYV